MLEEATFYSLDGLIHLVENEIAQKELKKAKDEQILIERIAHSLKEMNNDTSLEELKLNRRHVIQSLMQTKSEAYLRFQSINLKGADLRYL